jgi:hypothetical protein
MIEQAIGQGAFSVVNVCDDAEIPDVFHFLGTFNSLGSAKIVFFGAKIPRVIEIKRQK